MLFITRPYVVYIYCPQNIFDFALFLVKEKFYNLFRK